MKEFIAIGDVAGRYTELMQLIDLACPLRDKPIICLGDPNDRGKDSRKVIEFFMEDPVNRKIIQSNHAHMMIDFWENNGDYAEYIFLANGGRSTAQSYGVTVSDELMKNISYVMNGYGSSSILAAVALQIEDVRIEFIAKVPKEHIEYLKGCPMFIETDEVVMTHAPINPTFPLETDVENYRGVAFIWNRGGTRRRDKFQIHGHNAHKSAVELKDKQGVYGINLDSSLGDQLTAMHWPSKKLTTVPYTKP